MYAKTLENRGKLLMWCLSDILGHAVNLHPAYNNSNFHAICICKCTIQENIYSIRNRSYTCHIQFPN